MSDLPWLRLSVVARLLGRRRGATVPKDISLPGHTRVVGCSAQRVGKVVLHFEEASVLAGYESVGIRNKDEGRSNEGYRNPAPRIRHRMIFSHSVSNQMGRPSSNGFASALQKARRWGRIGLCLSIRSAFKSADFSSRSSFSRAVISREAISVIALRSTANALMTLDVGPESTAITELPGNGVTGIGCFSGQAATRPEEGPAPRNEEERKPSADAGASLLLAAPSTRSPVGQAM